MDSSYQLVVVEVVGTKMNFSRTSYVLVTHKQQAGEGVTDLPEGTAALTQQFSALQSGRDAAVEFAMSKHGYVAHTIVCVRDGGKLLKAEEIMQGEPDKETEHLRMWFVAMVANAQ